MKDLFKGGGSNAKVKESNHSCMWHTSMTWYITILPNTCIKKYLKGYESYGTNLVQSSLRVEQAFLHWAHCLGLIYRYTCKVLSNILKVIEVMECTSSSFKRNNSNRKQRRATILAHNTLSWSDIYIYIYSNNELTLHVLFLFNINYAN